MAESFKLQIVTPTGLMVDDSASSVTLPTSAGEIGVLPQHCKYTGALGTGVLEYTDSKSNSVHKMVVSGGFCTFSNETLTILADSVDLAENLKKANFDSDRTKLEAIVQAGDTANPEWMRAKSQLARIDAIQSLIH